jgi:hypothetical protein
MQHQLTQDTVYRLPSPASERGEPSLWERILDLVEQDLAERRGRETFVEVLEGDRSSCRKEIGELSAEERRGLDPALKECVAERLLDRHLAEQGRVDLVEKRRAYTKKVRDLTPDDLPALIEADRWRIEVERERAEFVRDARADLERLPIVAAEEDARPVAARVAGLLARR